MTHHHGEDSAHEHGCGSSSGCGHGAGTGEPDDRFVGKSLPESEFSDDDGTPDETLDSMLHAAQLGNADRYVIQAALMQARVFVPVVAVLDAEGTNAEGQRIEKDSHMATVSVQRADGAKAILAFSSTERMAAWDPKARPIPMKAVAAAQSALTDGAVAMIVDYGHDHGYVLEGVGLSKLAHQEPWPNPLTDDTLMSTVAATLARVGAEDSITYEALPGTGQEDIRIVINFPESLHSDQMQQRREEIISQVATALQQESQIVEGLPGGVALAMQMAH